MKKDVFKDTLIVKEEQKIIAAETARQRITHIQTAAANLFATSLVICMEQPPDLSELLWQAQEAFFAQINKVIPIDVHISDETSRDVHTIDITTHNVIMIANHPPFEKTVSPTEEQFLQALEQLGKKYLAHKLGNLKNLPAGIMRRAVLNQVMHTLYPDKKFRYHVVGSRYRPPLNIVQEKDGTIIVPYANEGTDGFSMLLHGMQRTFEQSVDPDHKHIVVTFPEGEQPQVIENLRNFHSGIFAAQAKYIYEKYMPTTILPICLAVGGDFSLQTHIMKPIVPPPQVLDRDHASVFAASIQNKFQQVYSDMLQSSVDGYYWQGMTYPYGGIDRSDILKIPQV